MQLLTLVLVPADAEYVKTTHGGATACLDAYNVAAAHAAALMTLKFAATLHSIADLQCRRSAEKKTCAELNMA